LSVAPLACAENVYEILAVFTQNIKMQAQVMVHERAENRRSKHFKLKTNKGIGISLRKRKALSIGNETTAWSSAEMFE